MKTKIFKKNIIGLVKFDNHKLTRFDKINIFLIQIIILLCSFNNYNFTRTSIFLQ